MTLKTRNKRRSLLKLIRKFSLQFNSNLTFMVLSCLKHPNGNLPVFCVTKKNLNLSHSDTHLHCVHVYQLIWGWVCSPFRPVLKFPVTQTEVNRAKLEKKGTNKQKKIEILQLHLRTFLKTWTKCTVSLARLIQLEAFYWCDGWH